MASNRDTVKDTWPTLGFSSSEGASSELEVSSPPDSVVVSVLGF